MPQAIGAGAAYVVTWFGASAATAAAVSTAVAAVVTNVIVNAALSGLPAALAPRPHK